MRPESSLDSGRHITSANTVIQNDQRSGFVQGIFDPKFLNAVYGPTWRRFVFRDRDRCFAHVCVAQQIESTPYFFSEPWLGYYDPFTNCMEPGFIQEALFRYSEWARSKAIVGELMRLRPAGDLENILGRCKNLTVDTGQMVSVLDCPSSIDLYFNRLKSPCRRQIMKAQRSWAAVYFESPSTAEIQQLECVHAASLDRCCAAPKWYLNANAYARLAEVPCFKLIGIVSRIDGRLAAMAGVLFSHGVGHVLFIGIEDSSRDAGACDLLYYSIVNKALRLAALGAEVSTISFGGGRGTEASDGLSRFKAKFSLGRLEPCHYLVLKHNPQALALLSQQFTQPSNPGLDASSQLKARHFPFLNSLRLAACVEHPIEFDNR
jgi:hypothetical protein